MQIDLTAAQNSFVELGIQEGRFRNREEAVQQALALWEERERVRVELLTSLTEAESALDRGEGEEYAPEDLGSLVSSISERGRAALARKR